MRLPGQIDVAVADGGARLRPSGGLRFDRGPADGWFPLYEVTIDQNQIAGRIRFNALQKPKVRIDRHSGSIVLDGLGVDYQGGCEKSAAPPDAQKF